jgi:hypothetical protein
MKQAALVQGNYRYWLSRVWDPGQPLALWLMLNPSTADASINDPTIIRTINFSKSWGFGGALVGNLYAWRASDPCELRSNLAVIGPDNDEHIERMLLNPDVTEVIVAWGANGMAFSGGRHEDVLCLVRKHHSPRCLGVNLTKSPKHPLYLKADLMPVAYEEFL